MRILTVVLLSVAIIGIFSVLVVPASAQSETAAVSGRVTDPQGQVVPDVEIQLVNTDTNIVVKTKTNQEGLYTIPQLQPGRYRILVLKDGFKEIVKTGLVLHVQDIAAENFSLQIGSVSESVTVKASDIHINTTDGSVSTTVDRQFVSNLPLNGRSFQTLILLSPGVVPTASDSQHPGEFSVNGNRQNANYFTVDGVSANIGVSTDTSSLAFHQQSGGAFPGVTALGTTTSIVPVDALEEFKIQTSTYSAEFGRQPGGQVQLVTRSGSNQFHGTAFEYLRNNAMDAQNWFNTQLRVQDPTGFRQPELRQNDFGGTVSGPILREKTFFFFSYEGLRLRIPVVGGVSTVPSLRFRQEAAPPVQPFLNSFPLPTGPEIQVLQDPSKPFDPSTNPYIPSGDARFGTGYSNPSSVDAFGIRIDHTVNNVLRLFGRYSDTPSNSFARILNLLQGSVLSARTVTLGATLSVTPRINNEFRFNYSRNRGQSNAAMDSFGGGKPLTLSQLTSGYSGPGVKAGCFGLDNSYPFYSHADCVGDGVDNYSRQINVIDNFAWAKGAHQLKFGIDWRRINSTFGPTAFGQNLEFVGETSIITGTATNAVFFSNVGARPVYDNYSTYAQDTWKLSRRLTLDLGLRWEINPAPHDANGVRPIVLAGVKGTDVSNVTILPPNAPFYKTFKKAFAPRLGVAYLVNETPGRETVLRGGVGVYHDLVSDMALRYFSGYPFQSFNVLNNVSLPIPSTVAQPPAFPPVPTSLPLDPGNGPYIALDPNLQLPYTLQWNVALQQALGNQDAVTLSYVASAGRQLTTLERLNRSVNGARPNPNVGSINYNTNGPSSDYQSLQAQYQHRFSRGLQVLFNYTWSHATDEVSNELDGYQLERGNAAFDVRHNASLAITYDLPKVSGSGAANRLVRGIANGWSLDSIFYARTGGPLDLVGSTIIYDDGTSFLGRPDVVPGQPFWIKDPTVPGGQRLNPLAFALPPAGRQGTLGRNAIYTPGMYQWNAGVRRQFGLGERLKLQMKLEAFNVLNHPLFGSYESIVGDPLLGQPTSTLSNNSQTGLNSLYQIGGPRSMQVSLRLSF